MEERYNSFAGWCRRTYGRHLYRIALDAGMTCPNRDGTLGTAGCAFCAGGSGDFAVHYEGQRLKPEDFIYTNKEGKEGDYIAYFQSYSNTYDRPERLYHLFQSALSDPLFAGISVATRPDCISKDVLDVLAALKKEFPDRFIWVELGLQTVHEKSAERMHRSYRTEVFEECAARLHELQIPVIAHMIIGLPDETPEDYYETVRFLNRMKVAGVKIHLLHFLKGTEFGNEYQAGRIRELTMEEYVGAVSECLARLAPDIAVHRLSGDGSGELLLGPEWSRNKKRVLNAIRHEMKVRGYVQGCLYEQE